MNQRINDLKNNWKMGFYTDPDVEFLLSALEIAVWELENIKNFEGGVLQPEESKANAMREIAREALSKINALGEETE